MKLEINGEEDRRRVAAILADNGNFVKITKEHTGLDEIYYLEIQE